MAIKNRKQLLRVQELCIEVTELAHIIISKMEAEQKALSKIKPGDEPDYTAHYKARDLGPNGKLTATLRRRSMDLSNALVELRKP